MNPVATVLGIDLSTKALDLVLLQEDSPAAVWEHINLEGATALERLRRVRRELGSRTWFEDHRVYLVAVERPYGRGESIHKLNQVLGAVVASVPAELELWVVTPAEWRQELGLPGNASKGHCAAAVTRLRLVTFERDGRNYCEPLERWPQDASDAYAIAYAAREKNAREVALALMGHVA